MHTIELDTLMRGKLQMAETGKLTRTIHFSIVEITNFEFEDLLKEVNQLAGMDIYSGLTENKVFLEQLQIMGDMYLGSIVKLRMDSLPGIGTVGVKTTSPLDISDDQGVTECSHFIYFRDSKILAMEYNHVGPRMSTLENHLRKKYNERHGELLQLVFQEILDENAIRSLGEGSEIRLLTMTVPKINIDNLVAFDSSMYEAFKNAAQFGEAGKVEIILRFEKKKNSIETGPNLVHKLRNLQGIPSDTFNKLKVKVKPSPQDRIEQIDLLNNKLSVTVTMPLPERQRTIASATMFGYIKDAYQHKQDVLKRLAAYEDLS